MAFKIQVTKTLVNFNFYEKLITPISIKNEEQYENHQKKEWPTEYNYLIPIPIWNSKTMVLLNHIVLNCRQDTLNKSTYKCGSILLDKDVGFVVDQLGKYFISFSKKYSYSQVNSSGPDPITKIIKFINGRIAVSINDYLEHNPSIEVISFINPENPKEILHFPKSSLYILKAFFKEENLSKKFTEARINEVIGEDPRDQFVLNALEIFKQEILKVEKERSSELKGINDKYIVKYREIETRKSGECEEVNKRFDKQIQKIQEQIQALLSKN